MIGLIGAMKVEIDTIESLMENKKEKEIGVFRFVSGTLHGKDVVAVVCGIGKVAAAICAQAMIMEFSPECIINTGTAGSLSPKLHIGDIVIADDLVQHDMDTSPIGDPIGFISGINLVYIPTDETVSAELERAAQDFNVIKGRIASGDQFIASDEKKKFIIDNFNAYACEMEGASIAQVCYSNHVPFGVVRAMSDSADGSSSMDYFEFLPMAAKNAADIIENFVKNR